MARERVPVREGLLVGDLNNLDDVRLAGARCSACSEVALGRKSMCPNCGSDQMTELVLANHGELWSFTVARHRPPGDYRGPEPFVPFGVGLVELPDGIRVMTPIKGDVDALEVGLPMRLEAEVLPDPERDLVSFVFTASEEGRANV